MTILQKLVCLNAHPTDYHYPNWQKHLIDWFLLALRIYIAWIFLKAGLTKIDDWSSTVSLFQNEYKVPLLPPAIAALMGTAGELVFSVLLIIGLFGRWAVLGLMIVNIMAVISYPQLFQYECPAAVQSHWYWGILLTILLFIGVGRLSIDQWLSRRTYRL